ncbi:MAG: PKD domain-containing protein, partial [Balneolaceae bacterium]
YTAIEKDSSSLPSWLSFDATTRTFSGTPLVTDTGTNTIEVTAADGNGSSTVDEFVIMVENSNDAPTILNALSDQVLDEDFTPFELARLDTVFTDEESSLDNSLTYSYSITGSSITASLTDSLMTLNSVPDSSGTNELIIQATDSEGITVSDTLEISVNSVNDKPIPNFALVTRALTSDGMEVQFADSSSDSKDPNGSITEWNWDFGNDLVSSEQSPSVLFTEEGTYDVKLVVTDNDSGIDSLTKQIDIELVLTDSISISGGSDVVADFEDLGVYLYFNSISDGNYTITTQQKINGEEEIPEGISFYIGNYFWSIDLNTESNQEPEFQYSLSFDLSETDGIDTMNVSSMTILKRNNESESWTSVEDIGGVVNFNTDLQILSVGNLTTFSDFILASKDLGTSNELLQGIPDDFELSQNYPNPFNPNTNIRFGLPEASEVRLEIFNILGQKVAVLVNGKMNAGYHLVNFDASRYSSGMYIYRIIAKDFVKTKKMLLLK